MSVEDSWRPAHNPWVIALTVTLATFMEVLDTSIANVSLPHIAGNLSAGVDESTWVLTSYLVANAIILPLSAWLSSLIGRKRYYMISVAVFTFSSLLSGLAPSLRWLVVFRIMQGLGGGGLQPSEQSILADTFPQEKLGMAMAVYGFAVVTAPIIGPTLGGWITDNFSWRWIFFINIPVGFISLALTSHFVSDPPHMERRSLKNLKIDYIGLGAVALGLAALQIVLDKGQREDWFASHWVTVLTAVAVFALIFLVFWELNHEDPIIRMSMLKERNFLLANVLMFVLGVTMFSSTVLLPLFLQTLMGYTATMAGLVLSPGGLITMATMPLVGVLLSKFQPRWLIMWGLMVVGSSLVMMSHFNLNVDYTTAVTTRLIQASGLGFLFVPINTAAYGFVKPRDRTQASGFINLSRNMGGGVGIAIATTILARSSQKYQAVLSAHMTLLNPAYGAALAHTTQALVAHGVSPLQASGFAPGFIYQELLRQASMLSYLTDFRFMAGLCFGSLLLACLLKKIQPSKGPAVVH